MKGFRLIVSLSFFAIIHTSWLKAQSVTVALPHDGNSATTAAPQGALKYQRGFYLVLPKEMAKSGISTGDTINCIGFTLGFPQDDTTKGKFKVYLQNTNDTVSRHDTSWTTISGLSANSYFQNGLYPGYYEWQVRTSCSAFSPVHNFSNGNLTPCQPPTHLRTDSITNVSAKLTWVAPVPAVTDYLIEYSRSDSVNWTGISTTNNYYTLTGLVPNKGYQWRIKSRCTSDSSDVTYESFITEKTNNCSPPSGLNVVSVTDTLAKLKWTNASGADYYTIRYRRLGTTSWNETFVFADSIVLNIGLDPGTNYQWGVSSSCGMDSVGNFISGPDFKTNGTTACYFPDYVSLDSLTSSTAVFYWDTVAGATTYELRYRAKDIIFWASAINTMTLVHDDSIIIPDIIGPYDISFKGADIDTFVYSGGGVYVAWEYKDSLDTLSSPNISLTTKANTLIKGSMGQDSIRYLLSFITRSDTSATALDSILGVNEHRPETRFCSSSLRDSVEILSVYALGQYAPLYTAAPVSALIKNYSDSTTYQVTLTVKDQATNVIRYTTMQSISLDSDAVGLIEFTTWIPQLLETDSIIISIPGRPFENVLNNNSNYYIQVVNPSIVSYDDGTALISKAGTDTSAGYTLSRHLMQGCGTINAVQVFLSSSAVGHSVYGIALDSNRVILAQSLPITPDSTQVNQYHSFYFPDTVRLLMNEVYYIGLGQPADTNGISPVGVQWEGGKIRDSAYFRYDILKDSLWHQPSPGRLMIRAELVPGVPIPLITGDKFLCNGTMDTLVASSILPRYADSVLASGTQNPFRQYALTEVLGTPNVYPKYGQFPGAWISTNDAGRDYLVLRFSKADSINFVDLFETLNPGTLDSIYAKDEGTNMFNLVWSGTAFPAPASSRKNRITFNLTPYKVSEIRLAFNMTAVQGFSAVDAVCIGRITSPGLFSSILWSDASTNDTLVISIPGVYQLTTTDATGCMGKDIDTIVTPVPVIPVIIANDTTICAGDSIKLKSSLPGGNIWSTGAITDSIFVSTPGYYWVMYNDGTGCGITIDSIFLTLDTIPLVQITGDTVICPGGFTTLRAGNHPAYLWSPGETSDTIKVSDPGIYFVQVTDGNGCHGYDSVITTQGSNPSMSITGNLLFCPSDSTTLYAGAGFNTYLWSNNLTTDSIVVKTEGVYSVTVTDIHGCAATDLVMVNQSVLVIPIISASDTAFCPGDSITLFSNQNTNNLWSTGETSSEIIVKASGSYFVRYDDGVGCGLNISDTIIIKMDTVPLVQILGNPIICSGSSTSLNAGSHPDYLWSTGENSDIIIVTTAGMYSVIVTDGNGCKGTDTLTTIMSSTPSPVITGNLMICPGDSTILHSSPGATYLWSNGSTADSIIVKSNGIFSVKVTNADGCEGTSTDVQTILFEQINAVISGNVGYCPMDSVLLDAGPGFTDYLWSTGASTQTITVKTVATYSVSVTDINGCKAVVNKSIQAFTSPVAFISGTLSFCDGGSTTTLEAGLGYKNYLWSTGETTHSIAVTNIGTYSLMITDLHGCIDTTSATVTVEGTLPAIPGQISGDSTGMCNVPSSSIYSVLPVPNSTCYIWHVPHGATIVGGFMMDSSVFADAIEVVFDNTFTGGYIEVSAHNDCGASPTWQGSRIYVSAAPGSVPGEMTGLTSGVCKLQGQVYSIPAINNATGYLWTVPLGATIVSGQGTNAITINFASSYRTGDICVQYSTTCGTSPFDCKTVSPEPEITGSIDGPAIICALSKNLIYSVPLSFGADAYFWTVPTGATIISGQGTNTIHVDFSTHSGIVTVQAMNNCGLSPSRYINVTIAGCNQLGPINIISKQSDIKIKVFPNPSEGLVNLHISSSTFSSTRTVYIIDALGRIVYNRPLPDERDLKQILDLRYLDKGMYVVHVRDETNLVSSKIILR
ncbi:MAG: fibronectin type III domain-containing protein [Saprospiraceae bacterium]